MTFIPESSIVRFIAGVWFLLCVGLIVFAWVRQDIHDMPIAFAWLMIFLTAPVGLPIIMLVGVSTSFISENLGITYQPFWNLVPMWIVLTIAGYFQWFVVTPWLYKKIRGRFTE
jgi:hypothetical protein